MEQLRLTLPELEQEEQGIRENLGGIVKNFVRAGWHLSRIDRSGAYKLKGYSSITEYARETFGMTPDGVSRFIHVYEKYSIQGDTPELREEYRDFKFSQLTEMLQLPEKDYVMIRPETKREDIRALKKFNKQSEHNPDNLLNWQQEPDDIIREAVKDFFFSRKKDLNGIYEQYGIGPYPEETVKLMARFLYHEKKRKFQNDRIFLMLYPDQVFIKSSDGELHDITWTEFFQVMGTIFDSSAAGKDTWENYFNPDPDGELEEQIPGQDNIMNHPEYLPGKLHGRKFEHCMYLPEEDCISEDCGSCEKKKLLDKQETKEQKLVKELKKPDPEEKEYLDAAARYLIKSYHIWMKEDFSNRVLHVDKSPGELKNKIGQDRTRWFATDKGTAHINMFDDYVQLWDEDSRYMGDYDWFYLAAAIQGMWNVVSLEVAEEKRKRKLEEQREEPEIEIAPAQTETIPEVTADAKDIKAEELSLENLSIQINTDVWPEDISDIPVPSELFIREYLEEEEKMLKDYLECDGLPERTVLRQQLKVAGLRILRNLVKDVLETEEETTQPELPRLKNNEERKEWLRNYKTWPLRHVDAYTGAKYYEYRFDNGAVLVAEEWKSQGDRYIPDHETVYLHLIGGPEAPRGQYGIRKWETHDRFNRFPDSETAIVEFLKAVQK
ncbi:hypothetical protein [Blautia caecimuris]|uniref:hypothetical protein n=1 Tax=Blautia caecimuris TaxID=1796615 RepID=UPI003996A4AC